MLQYRGLKYHTMRGNSLLAILSRSLGWDNLALSFLIVFNVACQNNLILRPVLVHGHWLHLVDVQHQQVDAAGGGVAAQDRLRDHALPHQLEGQEARGGTVIKRKRSDIKCTLSPCRNTVIKRKRSEIKSTLSPRSRPWLRSSTTRSCSTPKRTWSRTRSGIQSVWALSQVIISTIFCTTNE